MSTTFSIVLWECLDCGWDGREIWRDEEGVGYRCLGGEAMTRRKDGVELCPACGSGGVLPLWKDEDQTALFSWAERVVLRVNSA